MKIQAHFIYYYYYISSTSDHQALDPRGWGPCHSACPSCSCPLFLETNHLVLSVPCVCSIHEFCPMARPMSQTSYVISRQAELCLQNCKPLFMESELECWMGFFFFFLLWCQPSPSPLYPGRLRYLFEHTPFNVLYLEIFLKVSFKLQKLYIIEKLQTIQKKSMGKFPCLSSPPIVHSLEKTTYVCPSYKVYAQMLIHHFRHVVVPYTYFLQPAFFYLTVEEESFSCQQL